MHVAEDGATFELVLAGISMSPALPLGARLLVDGSDRRPSPGQVACIKRKSILLVHRVYLSLPLKGGVLLVIGSEAGGAWGEARENACLGRVVAYRFPDREDTPWQVVLDRTISLTEKAAALKHLLAVIGKRLLSKAGLGKP